MPLFSLTAPQKRQVQNSCRLPFSPQVIHVQPWAGLGVDGRINKQAAHWTASGSLMSVHLGHGQVSGFGIGVCECLILSGPAAGEGGGVVKFLDDAGRGALDRERLDPGCENTPDRL